MVIQYIERKLIEKSKTHRAELKKLGQVRSWISRTEAVWSGFYYHCRICALLTPDWISEQWKWTSIRKCTSPGADFTASGNEYNNPGYWYLYRRLHILLWSSYFIVSWTVSQSNNWYEKSEYFLLMIVTSAMNKIYFKEMVVETPTGNKYHGLQATGETSAVVSKCLEDLYLRSLRCTDWWLAPSRGWHLI